MYKATSYTYILDSVALISLQLVKGCILYKHIHLLAKVYKVQMSQFRKLVLTTFGKQQNGSRVLSNKINMPIRPKLLWLKWEEDSCSQCSKTREEAVTATYYCPAKKCLTSHIRVLYLGAHILLARLSANGDVGK